MQEIEIKNNELNLLTYLDDMPNIELIPASLLKLLTTELEETIYQFKEIKLKRKKKREEKQPP